MDYSYDNHRCKNIYVIEGFGYKMFILSKDGNNFINCNTIENLSMSEEYRQYHQPDKWWEIRAVFSGGSYVVIDTYYTEQECKNTFNRLCDKITKSREHETIDMGDFWEDSWYD